jgi:hypothetical protein
MPRSRLFRSLLVLIVVAPLYATSAWAAPRRELRTFDILARLWSTVSAIWSDSGCNLNPHGGCAVPPTKEGCKIDPHGRCISEQEEDPAQQPSADEGCMIDPHGACAPGS